MIFPNYEFSTSSIEGIAGIFLVLSLSLFVSISVFCTFLIRIFMMSKFDKQFKEIPLFPYYSRPLNRCSLYARYISPWGLKRNKKLKKIFGSYDFKSNTTRLEQIICNIYVISFYLAIFALLLFGMHYLIYCIQYWIHRN